MILGIPVPPWVHRIMIREHGPNSPTMRLCLFTVNAFMDESGSAFPSQTKVAKAASLGESTAQRLLARAIDSGWLAVETRVLPGKKWKCYVYRALIPDELEGCETMQQNTVQALMSTFDSQHGPVSAGGRPYKQTAEQKLKAAAKLAAKRAMVPPLESKVPFLATDGPVSDDHMVPPLKSEVPSQERTKFPSEVPISSSHQKFPYEARIASEARTVLTIDPIAIDRKPAAHEGDAKDAEIRTAIEKRPGSSDARIAKALGASPERVSQIRAQL